MRVGVTVGIAVGSVAATEVDVKVGIGGVVGVGNEEKTGVIVGCGVAASEKAGADSCGVEVANAAEALDSGVPGEIGCVADAAATGDPFADVVSSPEDWGREQAAATREKTMATAMPTQAQTGVEWLRIHYSPYSSPKTQPEKKRRQAIMNAETRKYFRIV